MIDSGPSNTREITKEVSNLQHLSVSNLDEAWKVTADNVIASVCVDIALSEQFQNGNPDKSLLEHARELFQATAKEISDGKLTSEAAEAVRTTLVGAFGYQFTKFLFEKSSLVEVSVASKPGPEEKRTHQRYAKAWESLTIPEDKPGYWKQVGDLRFCNLATGFHLCVDAHTCIYMSVVIALGSREQVQFLLQRPHGRVAMGETSELRQQEEAQEAEEDSKSDLINTRLVE